MSLFLSLGPEAQKDDREDLGTSLALWNVSRIREQLAKGHFRAGVAPPCPSHTHPLTLPGDHAQDSGDGRQPRQHEKSRRPRPPGPGILSPPPAGEACTRCPAGRTPFWSLCTPSAGTETCVIRTVLFITIRFHESPQASRGPQSHPPCC